jgi:hypothetical protein
MAIPKQVQRDIEELEAFEAQMAAADPENQEAGAQVEPDTGQPPETSEATEPNPVQVEATPDLSAEIQRWEQRYSSLQGKYNAEVPQLHAQNKQLQEQIDALKAQFEKAQEKQPEKPRRLVTDEDVSSFGEDLIDVQRRVARDVFDEYVTPLQKEVDQLKQEKQQLLEQVQGTSSQVAMTQFETRLRQAMPDFDQVNSDPRWVAWLDEMDPIIRAPRRSVAQAAYDTADVDAVAHYVGLFKQTLGAAPQPRTRELERQVTPTRASGNAPAPQGKSYTQAQWGKLYDQVAMMNAKGQYEAAAKLENELSAAISQGRVTA